MNLKNLIILFLFLITTFNSYCQNDTINLYYDIGDFKLTKINYNKINDYVKSLKDSTTYDVKIISSADFLGTEKSNFILSEKRASFIKQLLKLKNEEAFLSFSITNSGEVANNHQKELGKKGNAKDRKTMVIFSNIQIEIKPEVTSIKKNDSIKKVALIEKIVPIKKTDSVTISNEFGTIEVGKKFILKNLIFEIGTDKLKKKSYATLTKLVKFLKKNPSVEIEIGGHVCCNADNSKPNSNSTIKFKGSELSTKRARFVYKYLFYKGIKKNRMTYYGYGFQLPIYYPEKTKEDMNRNKRVEINITKI